MKREVRRLSGATAVALALAVAPAAARAADEKLACVEAYNAAQTLKRAGKLEAAHEKATFCVRDACGAMRKDCAGWLEEIELAQPTVVIIARDAAGEETTAVRVTLDGQPWLTSLDGTAKSIDPGSHRLHLEGVRGVTDLTIQIHEGEKNRRISAVIAGGEGGGGARAAPAVVGAERPRSIAPWILGGVGVAGLAVGGILGALVLGDKSTANDECHAAAAGWTCSQKGRDATDAGKALGPASTIALVTGGVAVGAAAAWLVLRAPVDRAPGSTLVMGPVVAPGGAALGLQGAW